MRPAASAKIKSPLISVLIVLSMLEIVILVAWNTDYCGKSMRSWRPWWDSKLCDEWNLWLDNCAQSKEKEMMLAAFAKLEKSMIDGSYLDISPFADNVQEAIGIYDNYPDAGACRISGNVEKWDMNGCVHYCGVELLIIVNTDGSYEVYNDYAKRLLAAFMQEQGMKFRLNTDDGVGLEYYADEAMEPLILIYEADEELEAFWGKFQQVCEQAAKWQEEMGGCLNQTVRIGMAEGSVYKLTGYSEDIELDFARLAASKEESAKLKNDVTGRLMAYKAQMQAQQEDSSKKANVEEGNRSFWHICQPNDTLWQIAITYMGSPDKIQVICDDPHNRIEDADKIYVGQRIYIPPSD